MQVKRKVVLFIATSLDGYIAAKDESLEWLFKVEGEGDNGFAEFYGTTDTVLMGKKTYDWVKKHEPNEFPYALKACYVFTRTPRNNTEEVQFVHGDIPAFVDQLKTREGKNIWLVGGGQLLHSFLENDLVDELIVTVAPAVLGGGIPLFPEGKYQLELRLKGMRRFNQFVELHYEVKRGLEK
ncbi:dihydrofolate reductase family protein [Paenibacillus senegalensis]|uniref:dihydrofolate reductase family protein n=1 Tax=Paenibacillus senegalensis TaxID=1465766 RepID=UPI000289BDA1|nr:dihydrofolate reductase family protein [Paenibacillus senegalensis]